MRRTSVLLLIVVFFPALSWADTILQVNSWATWVATNPSCTLNCTHTVAVSFLFNQSTMDESGWILDASTFHIASSGFLGSFSPGIRPDGTIRTDNVELWMRNSLGDEIGLMGFFYDGVHVGVNTLRWEFWDCRSATCWEEFPDSAGFPYRPDPTYQASVVTAVSVPEPPTLSLLLVAAVVCPLCQIAFRRHMHVTI